MNFTIIAAKPYDAHCKEIASTEEQLIGRGEVVIDIQHSSFSRWGTVYYSAIIKSKIQL